jgi:predicted DNA-binding transcriptional regulator AlpA
MTKDDYPTVVRNSELLRLKDVCVLLKISSTTLWRWRAKGILPKPYQIGPRLLFWKKSVIEAFINSQQDEALCQHK